MDIIFTLDEYKTEYGYSSLNDDVIDISSLVPSGRVKSSFGRKISEMESITYSGEVTGELATFISDDYIYDEVKALYSNAVGYLQIGPAFHEPYLKSLKLITGNQQIKDLLILKGSTFKISLAPNKVWSKATAFSESRPIEIAVISTDEFSVIPINSYEINRYEINSQNEL